MALRDIFGLIVRAIGAALVAAGLVDAISSPFLLLRLISRPYESPYNAAVGALAYFGAGVIVLLVAPLLVRLSYGRRL